MSRMCRCIFLAQNITRSAEQIDLRLRTATTTLWRMRTFTAVVERDPETKLFVGYVPGFSGAHSLGATLAELRENLRELAELGLFP